MLGRTRTMLRDRRGVTSLEYALMGALIFLAIVGGVTAYANAYPHLFTGVVAAFSGS